MSNAKMDILIDRVRTAMAADATITATTKKIEVSEADGILPFAAQPPYYIIVPGESPHEPHADHTTMMTLRFRVWAYQMIPLPGASLGGVGTRKGVVEMLWDVFTLLNDNLLGHDDEYDSLFSLGEGDTQDALNPDSSYFLIRRAITFETKLQYVQED